MKDKLELKSEVINFKVTTSFRNELAIKHTAMNMKESEFIRHAIENLTLNFKTSDKDIGTLIGSLGSIGNNINQIAHVLNIANKNDSLDDVDYEDAINQLLIIKESLKGISC